MQFIKKGHVNMIDLDPAYCVFTPYHKTFSKTTAIYNADVSLYKDFELIITSSKDDDVRIAPELSSDTQDKLFPIVNYIIEQSLAGEISDNKNTFEDDINPKFGNATTIISSDVMLTSDAGLVMPNKLTVDFEDSNTTVILWLGNENYTAEYDEYELEFIGPTDDVDDMLTTKAIMEGYIANNTLASYNAKITSASEEAPITGVSSTETLWVNKDNPTETLMVNFSIICYGPVVSNIDLLLRELKAWILKESAYDIVTWEKQLPELFSTATYAVIPNWGSLAFDIEPQPIYNPISMYLELSNYIKTKLTDYNGSHVDENLQIVPTVWQSLTLAIVGNPSNTQYSNKIGDIYQDYILVNSLDSDFIRLSDETKDFINKMIATLPVAQDYEDGYELPEENTVEVIDGLRFITFSSYSYKFRVLTKADYNPNN